MPQPQAKVPPPPADLMQPAPPLVKLEGNGAVSPKEALGVVVENYGLYRDISDRLTKLQEFVREQLK